MKVLIGIPSSGLVSSSFALDNLPAIIAYTKKHRPDIELSISYQCGVRTDRNRNIILERAYKSGDIDYILWLDEDMLYPHDIITTYLSAEFEIIGCLYFKRAEPHEPIGYVKSGNSIKPYKVVDPKKLPENEVIEVDGLGYGGMMVKMSAYDKMGDNKWTHYGENYHLPYPCEDKLTHDLQFCKDAQEVGIKIHLHTKIRPGHIGEKVVVESDWVREPAVEKKKCEIAVIMPTINEEKAIATLNQLKESAGMEAEFYSIVDKERTGFVATANRAYKQIDAKYYVYVAEDAYGGRDWLKIAYEALEQSQAGLFAFNDGKWHGKLASFGMVRKSWVGDELLPSVYKSHYADTELTLRAMIEGKLVYDPESVLIEVDPNKHGVNPDDKVLFNRRKVEIFGAQLELLNMFS